MVADPPLDDELLELELEVELLERDALEKELALVPMLVDELLLVVTSADELVLETVGELDELLELGALDEDPGLELVPVPELAAVDPSRASQKFVPDAGHGSRCQPAMASTTSMTSTIVPTIGAGSQRPLWWRNDTL